MEMNNSDNLPPLIDGHIYHRQDSQVSHDRGTYRYDAASNTLTNTRGRWSGIAWARGDGFGTYEEGERNCEIWTDITEGRSE